MTNPYLIQGPALISFSGGRTSAYMLRQILDAHGGVLPEDVQVCFANTGKERPETLAFVQECGARWGVRIVWLEWRPTPAQAEGRAGLKAWLAKNDPERGIVHEAGFERVGPNSASRKGEPFAALIAMKQYTPNALARFCTEELKVSTINRYLRSCGWSEWTNVVGLRRDEGKRVTRRQAAEAAADWKMPYRSAFPLYDAGVAKWDVDLFWAEQPFDLGISSADGNCDGCFLKSDKRLMWTERARPGTLAWWAEQEITGKGRFVTEYSMQSLIDRVRREPVFPGFMDDDERDVECGLICAAN
jgi:3'-phosphoadenosine 5'-phosphosulfate sulfotransferase (PAPS reductase)/FAD synthetase